jgi:type I restriction enzyme S subunit
VSGLAKLTGLVSPAYTVVTPIDGVINGRFAAHLFKLPAMIHRFWRYSQGLVDDQLQIRFEHFAEIKVNLPPLDDQEELANLFDTIDREIDLLTTRASALRQQKRGLMQKLLSGEWQRSEARVPEAAE